MEWINFLGELLVYTVVFTWGYDRCNISHGLYGDKWWKWGLLIVSLLIGSVLKNIGI